MSLINDALKKVQRLHGHEHPATLPTAHGAPAGHVSPPIHIPRRGSPPTAQLFILIGAGAAVLIVLSVIITVVLINRKPETVRPSAAVAPAPKLAVDLNAPSPVIVAPVISLPTPTSESVSPAAPASAAPLSTVHTPESSATPPLPAIPVIAVEPPPDPRIITFVDAIRVTGIRSTGDGSKVLMNDRVYRVNDVVDRLLGVKLIKVDDEMLTFSDANGVIYTKNF